MGNYGKLGVLFKIVSMSKFDLAYWLSVPEFVEEMESLANASATFSDELVLKVMMDIYTYKRQFPNRAEGFSFRTARHSIRQTAKALGVEKDVEVYL